MCGGSPATQQIERCCETADLNLATTGQDYNDHPLDNVQPSSSGPCQLGHVNTDENSNNPNSFASETDRNTLMIMENSETGKVEGPSVRL